MGFQTHTEYIAIKITAPKCKLIVVNVYAPPYSLDIFRQELSFFFSKLKLFTSSRYIDRYRMDKEKTRIGLDMTGLTASLFCYLSTGGNIPETASGLIA